MSLRSAMPADGIIAAGVAGTLGAKMKALRELEPLLRTWPNQATVRFLRNFTLENVEPLLRFECARRGIAARVSFAEFDSFEREVVDASSVTNSVHHDLVVLSLCSDGLFSTNDGRESVASEQVFERIASLLERLKSNTRASIAVTTLLPPFFAVDPAQSGYRSVATAVEEVNRRLADRFAGETRIRLVDTSALVSALGHGAALDPRFWYLYKAPFRTALLGRLAAELTAQICATRGLAKKVLVLDCDNTLWGGIIGEDGMDGIALGPDKYPGSTFYDFQRQVLELKNRGVILALCSKNNPDAVFEAFDRHPHTVLRKNDFAVWRINWDNKPANLRDLAQTLNVGLDSFVFVDDSPVECELVRQMLPEVTVLQVPANVYELPRLLQDFRGFQGLGVTDEDQRRTSMYQDEHRRADLLASADSLEGHLQSLELKVAITQATETDITRIAQLTQKTNQFNLTTRRYAEGEIAALAGSHDDLVVAMRVEDRFGSYGLTGVAIVHFSEQAAEIDAFLLSCRVLGRNVELALAAYVVAQARGRSQITTVRGRYVPSGRNQQTEGFFERAGFSADGSPAEDGTMTYTYLATAPPIAVPSYIASETERADRDATG